MKKPGAKERLLKTAGELFSNRGYGNVGINEIIEKSETAKASFYQHFSSKEVLCETWLDQSHKRSVVHHDRLLAQKKEPQTIIRAYFEDLKKWLISNDFRGCPYTNTAAVLLGSSESIQKKIEEHKLFLNSFFIEIAQRLTSGSQARQLGKSLFILYSGATTESQNLRDTWPVDAAKKAAIQLCAAAQN